MSDNLIKIASLCKGCVSLNYRERSSYYETLRENVITEGDGNGDFYHATEFLDGELDKCLQTDQYWCLQFYPDSPVGFYHAFSHDLNKLLEWGLNILEREQKS